MTGVRRSVWRDLAWLASDENACWKRLGDESLTASNNRVRASLRIALDDIRTVAECED